MESDSGLRGAIERMRARRRDDSPPPEPIPEPEIRATHLAFEELPRSPRGIAQAAEASGFRVRATYARGPWLDRSGQRVVDIRDSIRVWGRFRELGLYFVAGWHGQLDQKMTLHYAYAYVNGQRRRVTFNELRAYVRGVPSVQGSPAANEGDEG